MISARTVNYAMPPAGHYWKWSSGHDAIEWADGTTLALWPEVHTLLDHLAANGGLPPLGAVLLLLASCRDDQDKSVSKVRRLLAGGATRDLPPDVISRLEQGLEAIQQLPRESRTSLGAKCQLAQAIFEKTSFSLSLENSAAILNEISVSPAAITQSGIVPRHSADERVHLDLRGLHGAFKRFARLDSARLESRLRTGLDDSALSPPELPSPAEDTIEPRLLLDHLISSGGESGAAAAVAKRAIAMMNFPGRFGTPRDLPVGGIADITNRGTVDRLLPGELAWDDLVLAARLV
ncbi:MAG TPA: hypothetical protein VGE67_03225, partial [Haloferula sp.]